VDCVVVGAGSAGLGAAACLIRAGLTVDVLEAGTAVATTWRNRYDSLRLNTLRWLSTAPRGRMPRRYGRWVRRDDYIAYLERYTEKNRISVQTGVRVSQIEACGDGTWVTQTALGPRRSRVVVVASGRDSVPFTPPWPGRDEFAGRLMHSSEYRRPEDLEGCRKVLIVGCGNSGTEIAVELARRTDIQVSLAVRSVPPILPLSRFGIPLHPFAILFRSSPPAKGDLSVLKMMRSVYGPELAPTLPLPSRGPMAHFAATGTALVSDRGFVREVRAGRIEIVPAVEMLKGVEVVLADGSTVQPDVVVAATGFGPSYPHVLKDARVLDERGYPRAWAAPIEGAEGLFFVGNVSPEGTLREHGFEAKRVAKAAAELVGRRCSH
jgi:putative flavoprotein involved in K+ transport